MAVDLKQYDDWVIKNQKDVLDWVKMYSTKRYDDVKKAFEKYHRAKSKWQQIEAFEGIKEELKTPSGVSFKQRLDEKFTPARERLQKSADKYTDGDIDALWGKYSSNQDMADYERYKNLYKAVSTIPEKVDKYENVELDRAYRDNYDYKAMKALAEKYNFDYTDPKDRKEFLKHLSDIEQQRLKAEAYQPNDIRGMVTQMAYPVTLEHARQTDEISPAAVLTDLGSQAVMAGGAGIGNRVAGQAGEMVGGMLTAPAITEAGQIAINKKDPKDALADYGVGVATNAFAPGAIMGMTKGYANYFRPKANASYKSLANRYANEAEQRIRATRNGVPYVNTPDLEFEAYKLAQPKLKEARTKFFKEHPDLSEEELWTLWADSREAQGIKKGILAEANEQVKHDFMQSLEKSVSEDKPTVYKRTFIRNKEKPLTAEEINNAENEIIFNTPDDLAKEDVFWRWNKNKRISPIDNEPYLATEKEMHAANKGGAMAKVTGKTPGPTDLSEMGYTESPLNMISRYAGRYSEPLQSLGMNLGASTRLTDRKLGMADRYLNLPWKYGESEDREIDFSNPKVKAYMKAYGRYKGNEDYFSEPPKLKGYSDKELERIQKAAEIIKMKDIFGE